MNSLYKIIENAMSEKHTDAGYIVRSGGHTKFFIDYEKAIKCFEDFCDNQCFGNLKSKKGYIPNMQKTFYCMESMIGEATVEIRTVDEVDLVGTPKTWKSFNETIEDMRKLLEPTVKEVVKMLGIKIEEKK